MNKKELIEQLNTILERLPDTPEKNQEVLQNCRRGYQQCHVCPVLDCCDNSVRHDIALALSKYNSSA